MSSKMPPRSGHGDSVLFATRTVCRRKQAPASDAVLVRVWPDTVRVVRYDDGVARPDSTVLVYVTRDSLIYFAGNAPVPLAKFSALQRRTLGAQGEFCAAHWFTLDNRLPPP